MKPAPFKYLAPANIEQAIEMLATDDQARPLAGGQSLVPMMNLRLARPSALIDLNRIPGLSDIRETGGVSAHRQHDAAGHPTAVAFGAPADAADG